MKNNFNTSISGVNLELSVFFDGGLARSDFDCDFERIGKGNRDYTFFYTQAGEYSLEKMYTVTNREEFLKEFSNDHYTPDESDESQGLDFLCNSYGYDDDCPGVSETYPYIEIRGYCQGDYAKIYYNPDCLNDKYTEKQLKEYCHHTFYDAPLYCRLEIDGEGFDFSEYVNDSYHYDTDEIIKIAREQIKHDKKEYIISWLTDNLPEYPEYN